MKINASKRLASTETMITAASYKWDVGDPKKLGLDSIRAMHWTGDDGLFMYAAFDGESLDVGVMSDEDDGRDESIGVNIRRGQVVPMSKIEALCKKNKAPALRGDHLVYLLAGMRYA